MGYNEDNSGIVGDIRRIRKNYFDLQFWYDVSKRASKCAMCQLPIPPKTRRVGFGSRALTLTRKDGRHVSPKVLKYYVHYTCWVVPQDDHPCVDCGALIPEYESSSICFWCQMSPRYRRCGFCCSLVRAPDVRHYTVEYRCVPLESLDSKGRVILCRGCRSRADLTSQLKYTKIMACIDKTGEMWSG